MDFFKKLFGGKQQGAEKDEGIYVYIQLDRTPEVVRLRIDPRHEMNTDENGQRVTRKHIVGPRTFKRAEATFYFDDYKKLVNSEISGGTLTTQESWQAYEASLHPPVEVDSNSETPTIDQV